MREYFVIELLFSFYLLITLSCKTEDIFPDKVSNELKVSCYLIDSIDATSSKEVWIGCIIKTKIFNVTTKINFLGICWNSNTDTLPTIDSKTIKVDFRWQICDDWSPWLVDCDSRAFQTGIPVSESDTKLIVRGFFIFNDTFIRYSDPLLLNNPFEYAN